MGTPGARAALLLLPLLLAATLPPASAKFTVHWTGVVTGAAESGTSAAVFRSYWFGCAAVGDQTCAEQEGVSDVVDDVTVPQEGPIAVYDDPCPGGDATAAKDAAAGSIAVLSSHAGGCSPLAMVKELQGTGAKAVVSVFLEQTPTPGPGFSDRFGDAESHAEITIPV